MTPGFRIAGRIACVAVWFLALGAGLGVAQAQTTRIWTGVVNTQWSAAGNWLPTGTPQNGDELIFASGGTSTSTNSLTGLELKSITISATHTIGGNTFTVADGIVVNGSGTATLDTGVILGADQAWALDAPLVVNAPIDLNNHTLSMGGFGVVTTSRVPTGNGAIVKIGPASWDSVADPADVPFTGPITIEEGRVWAIGPKALGVEDATEANGTTVKSGASLYVTSYGAGLNEAIKVNGSGLLSRCAICFANTGPQVVTAPITLETSATISTDVVNFLATTVSFSSTAAILGPGDLTIHDNSTLVLQSSLHTFGRAHFDGTGAGVLRMGIAHALSSTGGIELGPNASLQLNGYDTTLKWIDGTGVITNGLAPAANLTIDNATPITLNATIQSLNDLMKVGAGELVLANSSGHSGLIDVRTGTVRVTNPAAFGSTLGATKISGSARLVLDGATPGTEPITLERVVPSDTPTLHVTAAAPLACGGTFTLGAGSVISGAPGAVFTIGGEVVSTGDLRITGLTLQLVNNVNQFQAGTITVDADAVFNLLAQTVLGSTPTKALRVMGTVNANGSSVAVNGLTGTGTLAAAGGHVQIEPAGTNVFPGVITGQPTFVKGAAGTLRLTGTAALGWAIADGGELTIASQQITAQHLIVNPGATLAWDVPMTHAGEFTASDTGSGTGASAIEIRGGNVTLSGTSSFMNVSSVVHVAGAHRLTLAGIVGGTSLTAYGTGVVLLDATTNGLQQIVAGRDQTPSGTGTIRLARSNVLDRSGGLQPTMVGVDAGSTFDLAGFSQRVTVVAGTGRIDTGAASGLLTLDGPSALFEGTFAGAGRVAANVAPVVFPLKGTHPFTGTFETNTTLDVAANVVMPAAVLARGGVVTIATGASIGALTLENTAEYLRVGSGATAGGITTGGLSLPAAATTKVWLTDATPRITVNGSVHLAGTFTYSTSTLLPLPAPPPGIGTPASLTIIDNDGVDAIAGTFTDLPEGARLTIGGVDYRVSYTGGTGNDMTLTPGAAALLTYHLAEGATGTFFDTDLLVANPTGQGVLVDVTFLPENGVPIVQQHFVYAMSRLTLKLDDVDGLEDASFSTIVAPREAVPLVVERTMRWDASGYGAHTEKATDGPASTWYFAEGSEGFFRTFLLLANPQTEVNIAHVQYLREGMPAISRSYELLPSSRRTIAAGDDAELINQSFGMTVTFDRPGVAERAMYFGTSPLFRGGHESAGVTATSSTWLLAEGATGAGFETFILVANPGSEASEVTFTFLPENGAPATITRTVDAASRITVNPEGDPELTALPLGPVATQISATKPVIAERAQYWPLGSAEWTEAHNSFGVTDAGTKWALAEGRAGGPEAYQTYILLANPGTTDAKVTLTFLAERSATAPPSDHAAPATKIVDVPAQRRVNVAIDPTGAAGDPATTFGTLITSDQPIVVERAMYWNVNGEVWAAGTNATATRVP